jgi:hypothetical protein
VNKTFFRRVVSTYAVMLVCIFVVICISRGTPPPELCLDDRHFLFRESSTTNLLTNIIFRGVGGEVLEHSSIEPDVLGRVRYFAGRLELPMAYDKDQLSNSVAESVDSICGTLTITGLIALGSCKIISSHDSSHASWVQALPHQTNIVSYTTTNDTFKLERVDRIAQFFELKVGVLANGDLIFGRDGHWPSDFTPVYTIELNARYEP